MFKKWKNGEIFLCLNFLTNAYYQNICKIFNYQRTVKTQPQLSKSDIFGVLQNDRRRLVLELLPASQDFDIYLETVNKGDIPWSQFYLGLSIFATVSSILIFAGLIKWIPSSKWMLFTNVLFIAASIAHMYQVRKLGK